MKLLSSPWLFSLLLLVWITVLSTVIDAELESDSEAHVIHRQNRHRREEGGDQLTDSVFLDRPTGSHSRYPNSRGSDRSGGPQHHGVNQSPGSQHHRDWKKKNNNLDQHRKKNVHRKKHSKPLCPYDKNHPKCRHRSSSPQ